MNENILRAAMAPDATEAALRVTAHPNVINPLMPPTGVLQKLAELAAAAQDAPEGGQVHRRAHDRTVIEWLAAMRRRSLVP